MRRKIKPVSSDELDTMHTSPTDEYTPEPFNMDELLDDASASYEELTRQYEAQMEAYKDTTDDLMASIMSDTMALDDMPILPIFANMDDALEALIKDTTADAVALAGRINGPTGSIKGRPNKLDAGTLTKLITALCCGHCVSTSCKLSEMGRSTYYDLRARYPEFNALTDKAEAVAIAWHLNVINKAATKHWAASAWLLQRLRPEDYHARIPHAKLEALTVDQICSKLSKSDRQKIMDIYENIPTGPAPPE